MKLPDNHPIKQILDDVSRFTVRNICKQIEILQSEEYKDLSSERKLDLLKAFNKELLHESFRDLDSRIGSCLSGSTIKEFKIYTPAKP